MADISHPSPNNHQQTGCHGDQTKRDCCRLHLTIITNPSLNPESEPSHAGLVLVNGGLAFLRRVFGLGEEHAVVAGGLFGFAHAAGLYMDYKISVKVFFCRFCLEGLLWLVS